MIPLHERLRQIQQARADAIPPRCPGEPPPLSFAQEGLWFAEHAAPASALHNMPTAIRIRGPLDAPTLAASFRDLQARHEILRTRFHAPEGRPHQAIEADADIDLPVLDLEGAGAPSARALALAQEEAAAPFRLDRAPLWRIVLLRLAAGEHVLLLTMHQTVSDGWSRAVLLQELAALYEARRSGRAHNFSPLAIQYADHALWQRRWLSGEMLDRQLVYWRRQLRDVAPVLMPSDHPRPPVQSQRGGRASIRVPRPVMAAMERLCRNEDATLLMGTLAAFQVLLHRHTGVDDIAVGVPVANRVRADTHPLIGLFANTIVLRADASGRRRFRQLLASVRAAALDGHAHQDLPFERVVAAVRPRRTLAHSPLFQVMFSLQSEPSHAGRLDGLETEIIWHLPPVSRCDLSLVLWRDEVGAYRADLDYSADLFDPATMAAFLDQYVAVLAGASAAPDRAIDELGGLDDAAIAARRGWRRRDELLILPDGHRVARRELEDRLATLSTTGEVAAQVLGGKLCAFAAQAAPAASAEEGDSIGWRDRLAVEMPDYMVPHHLVAIDGVPRREDGAVDDEALHRLADRAGLRVNRPVVLAASFAAAPIAAELDTWIARLGLPFALELSRQSPGAELLDPRGAFARNRDGANVVLLRLDDLVDSSGDLIGAVRVAVGRSPASMLILVLPSSERADELDALEQELAVEFAALDPVHVLTSAAMRDAHALGAWHAEQDPGAAFSDPRATASVIARLLQAVVAARRKVLVLDCDQTLWRGVCGEDGPDRVALDAQHLALQRFALDRREAGVLLCLCSRNNDADVWQVLERPDMLLRRDHLAGARINWRRKADNLRSLAAELGVGLESFVFVDDDPWECMQVEIELPEILTVRLPPDGEHARRALARLRVFDRLRIAGPRRPAATADTRRSMTLADAIDELELQVSIALLEPDEVGLASQLTRRTSQFHSAGRRRDEAEILASMADPDRPLEWLAVRVADRFGDHGLVGLIAWRASARAIEVDTLLLGLRALGRGVEHRMLAHLGRMAIERGLARVDVAFRSAARNAPARRFMDELGATTRVEEDGCTFQILAATAAAATLASGPAAEE